MNDYRTKEEVTIMNRIEEARASLKKLEALLAVEQLKRAGVSIGDIVICRSGEYRVCEIYPLNYPKAWVKGNPRKKDGTFGKAVRALYSDWTHMSKESA